MYCIKTTSEQENRVLNLKESLKHHNSYFNFQRINLILILSLSILLFFSNKRIKDNENSFLEEIENRKQKINI